jgi:hypothetical protein
MPEEGRSQRSDGLAAEVHMIDRRRKKHVRRVF